MRPAALVAIALAPSLLINDEPRLLIRLCAPSFASEPPSLVISEPPSLVIKPFATSPAMSDAPSLLMMDALRPAVSRAVSATRAFATADLVGDLLLGHGCELVEACDYRHG